MAELVAGKAEHREAAVAKPPMKLLEPGILRGEAAFARDVDDQQRLAVEAPKRLGLAVDGLQGDVGGEGHAHSDRAGWDPPIVATKTGKLNEAPTASD